MQRLKDFLHIAVLLLVIIALSIAIYFIFQWAQVGRRANKTLDHIDSVATRLDQVSKDNLTQHNIDEITKYVRDQGAATLRVTRETKDLERQSANSMKGMASDVHQFTLRLGKSMDGWDLAIARIYSDVLPAFTDLIKTATGTAGQITTDLQTSNKAIDNLSETLLRANAVLAALEKRINDPAVDRILGNADLSAAEIKDAIPEAHRLLKALADGTESADVILARAAKPVTKKDRAISFLLRLILAATPYGLGHL